jgi:small subunit ribosomal protein S6
VIRDIANWGEFALPKTITKHQATHYNGHYFVMRYDAGVATQEHIGKTLRLDPRIIRVGTVKLGDQKLLGSLRRLGKINWREGT